MQGEYTFVQNIIKHGRVRTNSHAGIFIGNAPFLLTILPAGSDLPSISPAGWHLWYCLANHSARPSLSLRQCVGFGTAHNRHWKQIVDCC